MRLKKFLLAVILIFLLVPDCSPAGEVKFAQVSDAHLSTLPGNRSGRMLSVSAELLKDAIKQINSVDSIDFVIFTGDMINNPNKLFLEKFRSIASQLDVPWYWTTGNHDIGLGLNKKEFSTEMNREKPYYSFVIDDFVFICMDGTIEHVSTAHAEFLPAELEWLDQQLAKYKDKYAVIFQHYPVIEPFKSYDHYILNANQYLEVIDKHKNVVAVVTGHYHAAKIKQRNNVLHVSSPSLVQYPNAFRVITISTIEEGVKFEFKFMPTTLEQVRNASYKQTRSAKFLEGSKADRDTTIILSKSCFPASSQTWSFPCSFGSK